VIYQIYYKEEQKSKLLPFAVPYYNEELTIFFENEPIRKLVSECKDEKVGVVSWKLADKMRKHQLQAMIEKMNSDYNVLSLTKNSLRHQMLASANLWHPQFGKTIKLLWSKLGYEIPPEAKYPVYQNAFLGRTSVYQDYVNNFLSPAMDLVLRDEELFGLMTQDSGYQRLNRACDLKRVKEKLKMDFYPLAPFIFERCPSLYFTMKRIHVTYL
jgi:hypothetical protein